MKTYSYEYITKDEKGNEIIFDVEFQIPSEYYEMFSIAKIEIGGIDVTAAKVIPHSVIIADIEKCWGNGDWQ